MQGTSKPLPVKLTAGELALLAKQGWVQALRTNGEFIVASYVVAQAKSNVKQGTTYDTSDHRIYQDPGTGLHWRDTGFFD